MFDLGIQELIVIFVVALLVFGPRRLPELARSLGKGMAELKRAMMDVKHEIDQEVRDVQEPVAHNLPSWEDIQKKMDPKKAVGDTIKDMVGFEERSRPVMDGVHDRAATETGKPEPKDDGTVYGRAEKELADSARKPEASAAAPAQDPDASDSMTGHKRAGDGDA